jgi:hypothetical protein
MEGSLVVRAGPYIVLVLVVRWSLVGDYLPGTPYAPSKSE